MNLDVEIYGVAAAISTLHRVKLELSDEADVKNLLAALKTKIPALSGTVIDSKADELIEGYMLNIEGQFYSQGMNKKIAGGEHIILLALASGG
jgi:hypothetical protein